MKKTILLSFVAIFIFAIGFYSFSGASFVNFKRAMATDSVKKVCISTAYGDIKIKLYNETPLHRDNFIKLAKAAYFDGTIFHRVIKNFMIQGGDPDSKNADSNAILGNGGPSYTIPAEIRTPKYFHKKGALAAARDDNPAKASSGSQFYIVQGKVWTDSLLNVMENNINTIKRNQRIKNYISKSENAKIKSELIKYQKEKNTVKMDSIMKIILPVIDKQFAGDPLYKFSKEQRDAYKTIGGAPHLDGEYTVFGEVYEGLDVVDKIAAVTTGANDRPVKDVKITVKVIE
jgi:cyclophilin family peptidyl-prolyl cis-trans isomerase